MTAGKPTARSIAWKHKPQSTCNSDVIPPLSVEVHPSDRAFETLEVYITSAIRMAFYDPQLASHLQKSLRWLADCRDWFDEAKHEISELKKPSIALQSELDNCKAEIIALRAQNSDLQTKLDTSNFQLQIYQKQLSAFGPRIREREVPPDAAADALRTVITSLKAVIERRDCQIVHLQTKLSDATAAAQISLKQFTVMQHRVFAHLMQVRLRRCFQSWASNVSLASLLQTRHRAQRRRRLLCSFTSLSVFARQRVQVSRRKQAIRLSALRWAWTKWLRASRIQNCSIQVAVRVPTVQSTFSVFVQGFRDLTVLKFMSCLGADAKLPARTLSDLSLTYVDASDPKAPQIPISSDKHLVDVLEDCLCWPYVFTLHAPPGASQRPDPPWTTAPT